MNLFKIGYMAAIAASLILTSNTIAQFQCLADEHLKLDVSDLTEGDQFGGAVDIQGNVAVVGAKYHDDPCQGNLLCNYGAAYIYRYNPETSLWIEEAKLLAPDGNIEDRFGNSVAISGNIAIIAARLTDDNGINAGSVYVYRYNEQTQTWDFEIELIPADGDASDVFGHWVDIDGNVATIGAVGDDDVILDSGAVYVYRYDPDSEQWNMEQKLKASNAGFNDLLGFSVAVDDDVLIAGAHLHDVAAFDAGAAYVFRFDPDLKMWLEEAKFVAFDADEQDLFGQTVGISGDVAVVGSSRDDDDGDRSGSAYVFRRSAKGDWSLDTKLTASDAKAGDWFGYAVSISNQNILIGARFEDHSCNPPNDPECNDSAAYLFHYDSKSALWVEQTKLISSDGAAGDQFGFSVSIDGSRGIVGTLADADAGPSSGSAYVFHGLADCNNNGIADTCDIDDGQSQDNNADGVPDECENAQCPWDLDGNGAVGTGDLLELFTQWGTNGTADFDENGTVGTGDLLILFANWGLCG